MESGRAYIAMMTALAMALVTVAAMASASQPVKDSAIHTVAQSVAVQLLFPDEGMGTRANSSVLAEEMALRLGLGNVTESGDMVYDPFGDDRSYYSLMYGQLTVRAPPPMEDFQGVPYGVHVLMKYSGNQTDLMLVYAYDGPAAPLIATLVDTRNLNATGEDNASRESVARGLIGTLGVPAESVSSVTHVEDDDFSTVVLSGEAQGIPLSWCNLAMVKFSKEDFSVRVIQVLPFVSADAAYFSLSPEQAAGLCEPAMEDELNGDRYVGSELESIRMTVVQEVFQGEWIDENNTTYSEVFTLRLGYEFRVTIDDSMYSADYYDLVVIDCNDGSTLLVVEGPVPIGASTPFMMFLPWLATLGIVILLIVLVGYFESSPEFAILVLQSFLLPVYMRIRGAQALDGFNRGRIFEHVRMYPGSSFTGLKGSLGMGNGTLAYHLSVLQKLELVRSEKDGRERRYYLCGVTYDVRPDMWLGKTEAKVLEELVANGPMSTSKVAERLQISRQRAHYNMRLLLKRGLAVHERPLWRAVQDGAGRYTQEG